MSQGRLSSELPTGLSKLDQLEEIDWQKYIRSEVSVNCIEVNDELDFLEKAFTSLKQNLNIFLHINLLNSFSPCPFINPINLFYVWGFFYSIFFEIFIP